jgi:hypothetical protein
MRIRDKLWFVLLAALAPEYLLIIAFGQFRTAWTLRNRLRRLWNEAKSAGALGVKPDVRLKIYL